MDAPAVRSGVGEDQVLMVQIVKTIMKMMAVLLLLSLVSVTELVGQY